MKSKKEIPAICQSILGRLPERSQWVWSAIADLERSHKASAVIMDFRDWAGQNAGDDFPKGILTAYLQVASDRLGSGAAGVGASAKDPEVVSLVRELTYASEGRVAFLDKQRARLAEVLKEFPAAEIKTAFAAWISEQDLLDSKNVQFLAGKFVQIVDSLCYSARRSKQDADDARVQREDAAARLQREAEAERALADKKKQEEAEVFDPLAE